jgi:hypothetical protein
VTDDAAQDGILRKEGDDLHRARALGQTIGSGSHTVQIISAHLRISKVTDARKRLAGIKQ